MVPSSSKLSDLVMFLFFIIILDTKYPIIRICHD